MPVSYHFIDFFQLKIEQLFLKFRSDLFFCLMMKILVVAAMPTELKVIKEWIKSAWIKANLDIDYLCCGIWNYETISSLEHYLTVNSEPTFIWNIWICGYRNSKEEKKSDPIQVASIINLYTEKEMVIPPFLKIAPLKTCFCGENVILGKSEIKNKNWIKDDEMYFDMESRWIEFVASKYKYPCLILKIPFDFIGGEKDVKVKNYKELTNKMNDILINLPYHDYLEKIILWIMQQ